MNYFQYWAGKIWQIFSSTVAAFFGVQTNANHARDFHGQSAWPFIIMGILLAVLLVVGLICIVNSVLV